MDHLYLSDDEIEINDCQRRDPPCGIMGEHTHGDRWGVFIGLPLPAIEPKGGEPWELETV